MKYAILISFLGLTSCATMTPSTNVASGFVAGATATRDDLKNFGPTDQPTGCEGKQRVYGFVSNIPPVQAWVWLNSLWMKKVQEKIPSAKVEEKIDPCVRNPYARDAT